MARTRAWVLAALAAACPAFPSGTASAAEPGGEGDPRVLAAMHRANQQLRAEWMDLRAEWMDLRAEWMDLRAEWMDVRIEQIEMLSAGGAGRSVASSRLHTLPFRWVPVDPRRGGRRALSYLVDLSDAAPASGVPAIDVEDAVDRAVTSWRVSPCLEPARLRKRADAGADPDLFDAAFAFGELGDHRLADVVHAGFMPPAFFDAVAGRGAGEAIIAISVTFIFVDQAGTPTDIDHDGNLDTATNEIYYNDRFRWSLDAGPGTIDLESVALHEVGHALGVGHLAPPPRAVMNPTYAGRRRTPHALDHAAVCAAWSD